MLGLLEMAEAQKCKPNPANAFYVFGHVTQPLIPMVRACHVQIQSLFRSASLGVKGNTVTQERTWVQRRGKEVGLSMPSITSTQKEIFRNRAGILTSPAGGSDARGVWELLSLPPSPHTASYSAGLRWYRDLAYLTIF